MSIRSYSSLEDHRRAIEDYEEVIRLAPNFPEGFILRGDALDSLGEHQAAIQDYDKGMRLDPEEASAYREALEKSKRHR